MIKRHRYLIAYIIIAIILTPYMADAMDSTSAWWHAIGNVFFSTMGWVIGAGILRLTKPKQG